MFMIGIERASHGKKITTGCIATSSFKESFEVDISFWNESQYISSWKQCIKDVGLHGKSAFITSLPDPKKANFIVWWPIYMSGENIFLRQQYLFLSEIVDFNPMEPYKFLSDRRTQSSDGHSISEWKISVADLSTSSVFISDDLHTILQ